MWRTISFARWLALLLGTLVAACGGSAAQIESAEQPARSSEQAGKYRIVLDRPEHVGQRYHLTRVETTNRRIERHVEGQPVHVQTHRLWLSLEAVAEVLALHPDGRTTKTRYIVERLETNTEDGRRPLVPPKTEMIAQSSPGTDGELRVEAPLSNEAELEALKKFLGTSMLETKRPDPFASDVPRALGESWRVNESALRTAFAEMGIRAGGPLRSSARLLDRRDVDGDDCLIIQGHVAFEDFDLPGRPPQAKQRRAQASVRFISAYPLDVRRPARRLDYFMNLDGEATLEHEGKQVVFVLAFELESTTRIDPLSK